MTALALASLLGAASLACDASADVFLRRTWPADQAAVAVLVNAAGDLVAPDPKLFPAGAPVQLSFTSDGPFRVLVATYVDDPELRRCGVRFGGDGEPLPRALGRWRSPLVDGEAELAFEPDPSPSELDLRSGCPVDVTCAGVTVTRLHPGPTVGQLSSVLALSATEARFGGVAVEPPARAAVYGHVRGETVTREPAYEGLIDDELRAFAWDGGTATWVLTPTQLTALDARGVPTSSISVGPSPGAHVALERDTGRVLFSNVRGDLYTWDARTSTVVAVEGAPVRLETFAAASSDRVLAIGKNAAVDVYDGVRWRREVEPSDSQLDIAVAGEDVMMAVPRLGFLLLRDEATRAWRQLERPFEPFPIAGTPAGGGRVILVGDAGSVGMWTGTRWCRIDSGSTRRLWAVSVSPDHRRAFVVGDNEGPGTEPAFIAVDLPAP